MRSKWIAAASLVVAIALMPGLAFGIDVFKDDFESFALGEVSGQGNWLHWSYSANSVVVDSPVYAGAKALDMKVPTYVSRRCPEFSDYSEYGVLVTDTQCNVVTYYFRMGEHWNYTPGEAYFDFFLEGGWYPDAPTLFQAKVYDTGGLLYIDPPSTGIVVDTGVSLVDDTWYKFTFEYKPSLGMGTVRWTVAPAAGGGDIVDVTVTGVATSYSTFYQLSWQSSANAATGFHAYVDDVSVGPFAGLLPGTLIGNVVLDDYLPAPGFENIPIGVQVDLLYFGYPERTDSVYLDENGNFALTGVYPPDIYDVRIKAASTLQTTVVDVDIPNAGTADVGTVHLTNGDVNGDNAVTPADVGVVIGNMD